MWMKEGAKNVAQKKIFLKEKGKKKKKSAQAKQRNRQQHTERAL